MREIRIHGRGGQGVKTVAQIIGRAAYLAGFWVQDFPIYGAERRGAPVVSFVRFDSSRILMRGAIPNPDVIIILDTTIPMEACLAGKKPDTAILVNASQPMKGAACLDATGMALEILKKPIPNTVIAGASLSLLPELKLEHLLQSIAIEMADLAPEMVERNKLAAQKGYEARR
ncbi:2-oxoacid:acceptor oxidoreductase family protein [Candidatus Woesearchaeota archaeon]|nr:2-oxoacid:acceptor oxidoreductase family protein [Candidatus Woesearchaeota archaeon]